MNHFKLLVEFLNFLNGMIVEKELVLSHSLTQLLKSMDNPLAKFLLDAHEGKDDLGDSFIDTIDDKNDYVSYIGKSTPAEGETEWNSKKRQTTKIGRLMRALLLKKGATVNDQEIEEFVTKFKLAHNKMFGENEKTRFEIVKGDAIIYWYNGDNYYSIDNDSGSTLHNSCMRYDSCSSYFDVYTLHNFVSMLILVDNETNKLLARAIVWNDIYDSESKTKYTIMDRVYHIDPVGLEMCFEYAKSNGWLRKEEQTYRSSNFVDNKGDIFDDFDFKIPLDKEIDWEASEKPYMDTMRYLFKDDDDGAYLSNVSGRNVQTWDDTDGGPNNTCETCGGTGTVPCTCDNGYLECDNCDGDGNIECNTCDGSGQEDCDACDGEGSTDCEECDGEGNGADCDTCNGTGETFTECEDCDGKGIVEIDNPQLSIDGNPDGKIKVKCKACNGAGKLDVEECTDCDGKGKLPCVYCSGGKNECYKCEGSGKQECEDCEGHGSSFCQYCDEGRVRCPTCDGDESYDCPDCN